MTDSRIPGSSALPARRSRTSPRLWRSAAGRTTAMSRPPSSITRPDALTGIQVPSAERTRTGTSAMEAAARVEMVSSAESIMPSTMGAI